MSVPAIARPAKIGLTMPSTERPSEATVPCLMELPVLTGTVFFGIPLVTWRLRAMECICGDNRVNLFVGEAGADVSLINVTAIPAKE